LQTLVRVPKFRFALGMLSLVAVVGCGTGGSSPTLVHTTGNFTNGSLKGSYVYQIHGVSSVNGSVYRQVGVFTADGNGNITGGTDDSSINAGGTAVSGVYTVGNDGTGFLTINTSLGQITLGITLVSSSKLELIEMTLLWTLPEARSYKDPRPLPMEPLYFGCTRKQLLRTRT